MIRIMIQVLIAVLCESIVLVNSENINFSNGFVHGVLWNLKALWIVFSETINILRNLPPPPKKKNGDAPKNLIP